MMANATFRPLPVLLLAALLSSCASTGSFVQTPDVDLTGVELTSANLRRQTFNLRFHVSNPNPFPLPVRAVSYQVRFDNEKFAGGKTSGSFSVPASGDESFAISVELDVLNSAAHLSSLLRSGLRDNIDYELKGKLEVDIPLVKPLPFSSSGSISMSQITADDFD